MRALPAIIGRVQVRDLNSELNAKIVALSALLLVPLECGLVVWRFGYVGLTATDGVGSWEMDHGGPPLWLVVGVGVLAISFSVAGLSRRLIAFKTQRLLICVVLLFLVASVAHAAWVERAIRQSW